MQGKKNTSKVPGHHDLAEQLQCALALILQVSGSQLERWNTILLKDIHSINDSVRE